MTITIEIMKVNKDWNSYKDIITKSYLKKIADSTLANFKCFENKKIQISLLLSDDEQIKQLNAQFRGIDKATNVLSFPDTQINYQDIPDISWSEVIYLGDIAFSLTTLIAETKLFGIANIADHFTHLFIHSILHLLGYDHENDIDADIMESLEIDILQKLNIPNPYINKHYQL
jgi:probable rRNA maturation factor